MKKEHKQEVVDELTQRLQAAETLLVADYRGLTMPQIDELRTRLLESGARFTVVKNTLTRRAAEAAGAEALLTLLEGPSAIAFLEADGDMVAAAKALADAARETRVLEIRGGVMQGRAMSAAEVESLATLPSAEVLRGQVLGAIVAPLTTFAALLNAPLQNLVGLIDARIEQLEASGDGGEAATGPEDPASGGGGEQAAEAPAAEQEAEPAAEAEEPVAEEAPEEEPTEADATAPAADNETENEEA
jgi:large subunit ribosomal protein L10